MSSYKKAVEILLQCADVYCLRLKYPHIVEIRKPTHGNCCTCQECGHYHDDCVCGHNVTIKRLIDEAGFSEKQLEKLFRESYGK